MTPPATASGASGLREALAEALLQHQRIPMFDGWGGMQCVGCDNLRGETDGSNSPRHTQHLADALLPVVEEHVRRAREEALRDGSRDVSTGAVGESPNEPTDPQVRDLAALAYLVTTCEALGIEANEEWDRFEFARAIHRRVRAALGDSEAGR